MSILISLEDLIEDAKKKGVDFGKGDPYNRLRYYTKMGWLPHMVRKRDSGGDITGHYPTWALDQLILIENLKEKGVSNEEIAKRVQIKSRVQNLRTIISSKETRTQIISYITILFLILILANEAGVLRIGNPRPVNPSITDAQAPIQIIDSGTAFVPKDTNKIFIKDPLAKQASKVYVTFTDDYTPATRFWVSEIKDYEGFTVQLDSPVAQNTEFSWWITN